MVHRESAASKGRDLPSCWETGIKGAVLIDSSWSDMIQEGPEAKQLVFAQHNQREHVGVGPVLIITLILPASSLSQLLLCFGLPSSSLEQSNPSVNQSWGLGLRKRVMKHQQEEDGPQQGKGCVLKCAGGASAWTKVKKGGLQHLTYISHRESWQHFGAKHCWFQGYNCSIKGWGESFLVMLVCLPSCLSSTEN